ncbi:TPA: hypothetical protein ACJG4C_004303 [Salmonella enterica subsp. diarizonae serovar 61:r:z53]
MSAAKKLPDAVLSCLYRWMQHNGELDKLTLKAAAKQTQEGTPEGDAVRQLRAMYGNYDGMFDAGYFDALHPERAQKRRCELVAETMGADAVKEILTDERIALLFPATPPEVRKTRLPLSVGSDGFDRQMDYTIKAYLRPQVQHQHLHRRQRHRRPQRSPARTRQSYPKQTQGKAHQMRH